MKSDILPDPTNRLAYLLGLLFHPYPVSILTLLVVLRDVPLLRAVGWVGLLSAVLIVPLLLLTQWGKRRERYTYQRVARTPLYVSFVLSVLVCLFLIQVLDGPSRLVACFLALLIWLPVQLLINTFYTKISVHAAVTAACSTGLLWFGELDSWLLRGLVLLAVLLTGWARHRTKNHTLQQIGLGWLVGAGAVLVAFPLVL